MHVIDSLRFTIACPETYGLGAITCAPLLGSAIQAATSAIRRLAAEVLPTGLVPRDRVELGSPVRRILSVARSEKSDLIVMGMRRRSWWRRMIDPSLTELVARRSSCPVLVVHGST